MNYLPDDFEGSWTLARSVSRRGICLHSGKESEVYLYPSSKVGFHLSWKDRKDNPLLLSPQQIFESKLCTTLQIGDRHLSTVEHLFAALIGCGLTHVHIEVSGDEIPILDGSALGWVDAILEVGLKVADTPRLPPPLVEKPIIIHRGNSVIAATPADRITFVGMIDFPYEPIGQQMWSIELTPQVFVKEVAPARTFGFLDQLEMLKSAGLIQGGSLHNALVCDSNNWINPPLRFDNEPIRHKILDLIGDLALVGLPQAQILVYRGSHGLHSDLAIALQ